MTTATRWALNTTSGSCCFFLFFAAAGEIEKSEKKKRRRNTTGTRTAITTSGKPPVLFADYRRGRAGIHQFTCRFRSASGFPPRWRAVFSVVLLLGQTLDLQERDGTRCIARST